MNDREISEIRKRYRPDKNNIGRLLGCYINEKKEIISQFDQSVSMLSAEETESVMSLLRKTLSGTKGKNLIDIPFSNQQVVDSTEHRLLERLRNSELTDNEAVNEIFKQIAENYPSDTNLLILLSYDCYDVPSYHKDGVRDNDSSTQFRYILCTICPVKMTKSTLGFRPNENRLGNITPDFAVSSPEAGFMYPSFDGRTANIYSVLFYTKSASDNHTDMVDALFHAPIPMPAAEQKQVFGTMMRDTLADECSIDVMKQVQEKIADMIEEHKATKDPDPLVVSKETMRDILTDCGVSKESTDSFAEQFDRDFGLHAEMTPMNLVDTKHLAIKTPDVSIKLSKESSDAVEARIIDGQKYLLIRADGIVEVNGIEITIDDEDFDSAE